MMPIYARVGIIAASSAVLTAIAAYLAAALALRGGWIMSDANTHTAIVEGSVIGTVVGFGLIGFYGLFKIKMKTLMLLSVAAGVGGFVFEYLFVTMRAASG